MAIAREIHYDSADCGASHDAMFTDVEMVQ
jgi:hypothetical protein